MAGGPYRGQGGWYHIVWSDANGHPEQPKKKEQLKTKQLSVAKSRTSKLETLYDENRHDPWIQRWYNNPSIKHLVTGGLSSSDLSEVKSPSRVRAPVLTQAVEQYIAYKTPARPDRKQSFQWAPDTTAPRQISTLRGFTEFCGPETPIASITDQHLEAFVGRDSIRSEHTVANYIRRLTTFFNWCVDQGWIDTPPSYDAPTPQADIPVFIYNDELLEICRYKLDKVVDEIRSGYTPACDSQLYMPMGWILIRLTGMRPIELRKLHLPAVDIPARQIRIGVGSRTKTAAQRNIPMGPVVYHTCKLLLDPDIRKSDRRMKDSDHLFGRPGKASQRRLSAEFTEARREVLPGRDEVTLYTLRDTRAVQLLARPSETGNPLFEMKTARDLLGHASIRTTEKYWKAVPHRVQHQRLQNSTIFCKILREFHQRYLEIG